MLAKLIQSIYIALPVITLSILIGFFARNRTFGFWGNFIFSLLFTPISGLVFALAQDMKPPRTTKNAVEKAIEEKMPEIQEKKEEIKRRSKKFLGIFGRKRPRAEKKKRRRKGRRARDEDDDFDEDEDDEMPALIKNPDVVVEETAKSFEDVAVWQKAHAFAIETYRLCEQVSQSENDSLCLQLKKSSQSIASGIAEAFSQRTKADKMGFINKAEGCAEECKYYLILLKDVKSTDTAQAGLMLKEVSYLLKAYSQQIKTA